MHGALQLVRRGNANDGVEANINSRYLNRVLAFIVSLSKSV